MEIDRVSLRAACRLATTARGLTLLTMFALLTAMTSCDPNRPAASAASTDSTATSAGAGPHIVLADGASITVEIASDDATRQQGLMYRDRLAADHGMIFLFATTGEFPFWMKDTIIPLDMIWIDDQKRVVHVAHDVQPCKADPCPNYPPGAQARYVLEVAAGVAAKHHVQNGQTLRFESLDRVVVQ